MLNPVKEAPRNHILNCLPTDVYEKIAPSLEPVEMVHGATIYQPYEKIEYIYFPENSVISVVTNLENGSCVETGIIGNDGLSGTETILTEDASPREAMVQLAGFGNRLKVEDFLEFFESEKIFAKRVMRYVYSFIGQISQNPACLCFHTIEKRLARWLLMFHDRADRDEMFLTQEFIAVMLGVHRPSVTKFAVKLQEMNLIRYNRGKITILDRPGLLRTSCECYETICQVSGFPSR